MTTATNTPDTTARDTAARDTAARQAGTAGSPRHAGLHRDDVVDAALALVDAGGGAALTMRKLGAELGVAPNTIYWHVGNRDELIIAVVQRQAERHAEALVVGDTPAERIMSATRNIWRNALDHRNVTALATSVGATTLLELPLEVALLAELEAGEVTGADARDALRAILACVAGFLVTAWRREDIADDLRPSHLWSGVDDTRVSDETLAIVATPSDLGTLFDTTLNAVIKGVLQ